MDERINNRELFTSKELKYLDSALQKHKAKLHDLTRSDRKFLKKLRIAWQNPDVGKGESCP